jgi:NTE family protein
VLLGGLFCLGYNAAQIDSIFRTTNFDELINDFIQGPQKTFMRRNDELLHSFALSISSILIPQALSKGL